LLTVLRNHNILLRPDQKTAIKLVAVIRSKMPAAVVNMLHLIQETEICAFGEKSFFYYKKRYNLHRIPFSVIKPDLKVVLKNDLYTPDITFAEERVESKVNDLSSKDK
jgi:hypothetical protein